MSCLLIVLVYINIKASIGISTVFACVATIIRPDCKQKFQATAFRVKVPKMEEDRTDVKRQRSEISCGRDMISELPDELLMRILSNLSTEHVIPTGALSKRWKTLWKGMRDLKFDKELRKQGFTNNVLSALVSHGNSLRSLKISVRDSCEHLDLAIWTAAACARNVTKLVLILHNVIDPPVFPASILGHPNSLHILKLVGNLKFNIDSVCVDLKSLKELHLHHVRFEDAESLSLLLAGCSNLQELVVNLYIASGVEIFAIAMKSLERLTLGSYHCEKESFVIEAPCLKYLNLMRFDGIKSCTIGEISEIDEAKIAEHDENMAEEILRSITTVKVLSLCSPVKFPEGKIFWRLTSLELSTYGWNWCYLLCRFLDSCPWLKNLKIIGGFFSRLSRTWDEPQLVPACFLNCLQTLEWSKYIWDGDDDRDVATYILKHAVHLKKATFITSVPDNNELLAQRSVRMCQLAGVVTASASCTFLSMNRGFDEYYEAVAEDSDLDEFLN